jgi:FkbM family methyltransferase
MLLARTLRRLLVAAGIVPAKITVNGHAIRFKNTKKSEILKKIAVDGRYGHEPEMVKFIENYPEKGRFIDGGANIGFLSLIAKDGGMDTLSIEPLDRNVTYIESLGLPVLHAALGDKEGSADLHFGGRSFFSAIGTITPESNGRKALGYIQSVSVVTLSSILDNRPALIKLDLEGAELSVLQELKQSGALERADLDFIIEIMIGDKDKQDIFDLMQAAGFEAYLLTRAGVVPEDRPITLPQYHRSDATLWRNHYFTKRPKSWVYETSEDIFGGVI